MCLNCENMARLWSIVLHLFQLLPLVHLELIAPFPVLYPHDLGSPVHLRDFFQYSRADMGFTRIFSVATGQGRWKFPAKNSTNPVDLTSIIYRTHRKKGVIFHFQGGPDGWGYPHLHHILNSVDKAGNIYKIPVTHGPGSKDGGSHIISPSTFVGKYAWKAKIAFGFTEPATFKLPKVPETPTAGNVHLGYTQGQIEDLATLVQPYCTAVNYQFYVALNVHCVGAADKSVNFDYVNNFRNCRLLLYTMPNMPRVNVLRVKEFLFGLHLSSVLVLAAGRSLPFRLYSHHAIAWGYAEGHAATDQLDKGGLLQILKSDARMIRLPVYAMQGVKTVRGMFAFRALNEEGMRRSNCDHEILPYLMQVLDKSRLVLLHRKLSDRFTDLFRLEHFLGWNHLPFIEAQVLTGSWSSEGDTQIIKDFWTHWQNQDAPHLKIIFSFMEGFQWYTQKILDQVKETFLKYPLGFKVRSYGIMLEVGLMPDTKLDFGFLLSDPGFKYLFLKDDENLLTDYVLEGMARWLPAFQDLVVILVMNDQYDKVNQIYRFFSHRNPVHTNPWMSTIYASKSTPSWTSANNSDYPTEAMTEAMTEGTTEGEFVNDALGTDLICPVTDPDEPRAMRGIYFRKVSIGSARGRKTWDPLLKLGVCVAVICGRLWG